MTKPKVEDPKQKARVLELVEREGWNATAFQTLETGFSYFFHEDSGCVAYADTGSAWVAAGAPIARKGALAEVAEAFTSAARAAGKRACFFGTEERFRIASEAGFDALRLGEQPVWDPRAWPETLRSHKSLREQLRRARAKGVVVRELTAAELGAGDARTEIGALVERWLSTRALAPMGFLVRVEPFEFPDERRCFVAELGGKVVGFAGLVPVPARPGWFLEDLLRDPAAPNGTGELLVDAVMRATADAGTEWLTLGLAPLSGNVAAPLRVARHVSRFVYDFKGLRAYKAKLRPKLWCPIYLSYPKHQSALLSMVDALSAFTGDGFLRFGWRSLLRGPTFVLRALAFLLIPWIAVLVLAPSDRWFASPWIKWAWIVFDLMVLGGLLRLLRKPKTSLMTPLLIAVSADAVLTLLEALLWNLPRASDPFDYLVIVVACVAPALASVVLWGARRMRFAAG